LGSLRESLREGPDADHGQSVLADIKATDDDRPSRVNVLDRLPDFVLELGAVRQTLQTPVVTDANENQTSAGVGESDDAVLEGGKALLELDYLILFGKERFELIRRQRTRPRVGLYRVHPAV